MNTSSPHVVVLPFPAQGHVNPLMNFSQKLAKDGFKITFINTEFNHKRAVKAANEPAGVLALKLVSIPDGLGPEEDRNDLAKLCLAISSTMGGELEKLIEGIRGSEGICCLLCDVNMAWALEVARKLGIRGAVLCPSSAATFALELHMPKLIHDGILDSTGFPIVKGEFELSPEIPKMNTADIAWCCIGDSISQKIIYDYISRFIRTLHLTEWWLCNTTSDLEPGALSLYPKIQPIGPLIQNYDQTTTTSLGQFWEEDLSCLTWLDQHPHGSVIYVAFGSFAIFDQAQFTELALGLELTQRPFLWVVREDEFNGGTSTKMAYPDGFEGRNGKIVKWAPQKKVLSHPAIACFITHCGWNSTMEGLSNGVPFLCWPYFADQFYDRTYICDAWKVGLGFERDEQGRILRGEIKKKVEMLLGDDDIRKRSEKLKKMVIDNIAEGGVSSQNYRKFVDWLKE